MSRLIDADELKEVICRSSVDTREKIENIIDNAPTVKPQKIVTIPPELIEKLASCVVDIVGNIDWEKAIEAYKARPQGEWIVGEYMDCHSDILPKYTCPFCGEVAYRKYDFCHCGADMRKEAENEQTDRR